VGPKGARGGDKPCDCQRDMLSEGTRCQKLIIVLGTVAGAQGKGLSWHFLKCCLKDEGSKEGLLSKRGTPAWNNKSKRC